MRIVVDNMSEEKLFTELEELLKIDDNYSIVGFLKNNVGALFAAISLLATFFVFVAKVIGYLIASVNYQYWNLDEHFWIEDDKAYLKLGVVIIYYVLTMSAYIIAQKYAYIWELYDCQIYVFCKMVQQQEKILKANKKTSRVIKKNFDVIVKVDKDLKDRYEDYPDTDDQIGFLRTGMGKTEEELRQVQKKFRNSRLKIIRWKLVHIVYLMMVFFIASLASFILQATTGLNASSIGVMGTIRSTMIFSVIIMAEVMLGCWLRIKLEFKIIMRSYLKNKDRVLDSEFIQRLLHLLEIKADEMRHRGIKQIFSDKALKGIAISILYLAIVAMTFLPISIKYKLDHLDTFYIVEEEGQDYIVMTYQNSNYILAQCNIFGNAIVIDTNQVYITKEPLKMERHSFTKVEKK